MANKSNMDAQDDITLKAVLHVTLEGGGDRGAKGAKWSC